MRSPTRISTCALLLCAILLSHLVAPLAQEPQTEYTRPRRAATAPSEPQASNEREASRLSHEPFVRIGLMTDARSVTITTEGRLLSAQGANETPAPLEVSRVRIEPRVTPALAPPAQAKAKTSPTSGLRLASRASTPLRSAVVYATAAKPIIEARAPVLFASDDEALHPVRLNEKSYRGRLEVFVNMRGTLTVVNVVGLEEYLRGVVPNELSPGGFPEIEALKAQAVAARTYAVANRGQFASEGFDLLPTTRSQVYGGRSTEHPLTDRAVAETRGRVATYRGRPINALYTSTCGGHTEDGESIFGGEPVPYLRARACLAASDNAFEPSTIRTSRDLPSVREAEHTTSARDVAVLSAHGFKLPARLSDEWLAAPVGADEMNSLLASVAVLSRQPAPSLSNDATRPGGFSTALALALDGESRGRILLNKADVDYILSFRDADDIPDADRADVAQLLREGHLTLNPDATLRPRQVLTRARALRAVRSALESRNLLKLQKASVRTANNGAVVLRGVAKAPDRRINVSQNAHLFRAYGEQLYPVREVVLVGSESVVFHTDARAEIDYLEVRPAPNGAASDRFSNYSNWAVSLTPSEALDRLARHAGSVGAIVDMRVRRRGASGRVLDLEIIGTRANAHVTGGRIRTALSLREQLFVIDRRYDETGRVVSYTLTGRGWGHGVGMCQVGAYGLARTGASYEKILKTYYTDISLTRLY